MKTVYFTQSRLVKISDGTVVHDWCDACFGHDNFDMAMRCYAESEQIDSGNIPSDSDNPVKSLIANMLRYEYDQNKASGVRCESRLIKRTITEEVIDA